MSNTYQLTLLDPFGAPIAPLAPLKFAYTLATNAVCSLTVELSHAFDPALVTRDCRVTVERSIDGGPLTLEGGQHWLVRGRRVTVTTERRTVLRAFGAAHLLGRRRIAYDAETAYTSKSGAADDVMKAFVRENLGTLVDSNRDYTAGINLSPYVVVQGNAGAATSVSVSATRDPLLDTLRKIAQASTQAGTYLAFDVVWNGGALEFRTYTGQRGLDHRSPGGLNPVILSAEGGTLYEAVQDDDWADEVTVAIAGGQGQTTARAIGTAADTTRRDASPFGAIEDFVQNTNSADATVLANLAAARVRQGRPRQVLEGRIQDSPGVRYGREWGWGDYVTVSANGGSADARVEVVTVTVADGKEDIDAQVRTDG